VGVATQLLALQSTTNTMSTNLNASLNRPKALATLQDKCPMLVASLLAVCEVATTAALPMHWSKVHTTLKPAEWAAHHARALDSTGSETDKLTPLIPPPMASDLGKGRFTASSAHNPNEGMSMFRIWLSCMPSCQEHQDRNRMFEVLAQGVGTASFEAQQMALINNEFELPQSTEEFRGHINGYQVLLRAFLGVHSRLCVACEALAKEVDCITTTVINVHLDKKVRQQIFTLILAWTWRETNNCLTRMTNYRPPPSSPSMVAAAAVTVPAHSDIAQCLKNGCILHLTSLPPALFS